MARRSKGKFGLRGFIILLLVTVIGGVALNATGNMSNPFEYWYLQMNTPALEDDGGFQMVQLDDSGGMTNDLPVPEDMPDRGEMPQTSYSLADYFNFSWRDAGQVLYNLWLMFALSVAVIVVARPIGWIVKQFKQIRQGRTNSFVPQQSNLSIR